MIACVGGGSNAIGIFTPFVDDAEVALIGVEAAGEGLDSGRHGASLAAGSTGVLHGSLSSVIADEEGQILEAHSVSAGLDYPGVGPEHAHLRDTGRASYVAITDDAGAGARSRELARLEGIIPALESSHAIAWLLENPARATASTSSVSPGAATRTWPRSRELAEARSADSGGSEVDRSPSDAGEERIARAPSRAAREDEGRAALMPYMMAGFPDREIGAGGRRAPTSTPGPT